MHCFEKFSTQRKSFVLKEAKRKRKLSNLQFIFPISSITALYVTVEAVRAMKESRKRVIELKDFLISSVHSVFINYKRDFADEVEAISLCL